MNILDSFSLANTKRSVRPVRTALTITSCSLLFAVLLFGAFISAGLVRSAAQLRSFGFNTKFYAMASSNTSNSNFSETEKTARQQMDTELRDRRIVITDAIRNSAEYQAETSRRRSIIAGGLAEKEYAQFEQDMRKQYSPRAVYHYRVVKDMLNAQRTTGNDTDPWLTLQKKLILEGQPIETAAEDTPSSPTIMHVEQEMLGPLLQPGQSFAWQPGDPYPLIVPYGFLSTLSGKTIANLPPDEQLKTYGELIKQYTGHTLTYCYRNATAQSQLVATLQYNKLALHDDRLSTKPFNVEPCAPLDEAALINADVIPDPKDKPAVAPLFPQTPHAAHTEVVHFKIVGFAPTQIDEQLDGGNLFSARLSSVNKWGSYVRPAILPSEVVQQVPLLAGHSEAFDQGALSSSLLYFSFANRDDQKRFIESGCKNIQCMQASTWSIENFGNMEVYLEQFLHTAGTIIRWAAIIIGAIAAFLMLTSIGKIIADSRREIAVFRSLGARSIDIIQIYLSYGLLIAGATALLSLAMALGGAAIIANLYQTQATTAFITTTGAFTSTMQAQLFGFNVSWTLLIIGALVASCIVGTAVALVTNSRRNLVQFMKEE